jgi:hypothetical protein
MLQDIRRIGKPFALAVVLTGLLALQTLSGCSGAQRTTRGETTTTTVGTTTVQPVTPPAAQATTTTTQTTATDTEIESRPRGFLGGIFHAIGEIVAFPFRLIGGIFDAIF